MGGVTSWDLRSKCCFRRNQLLRHRLTDLKGFVADNVASLQCLAPSAWRYVVALAE